MKNMMYRGVSWQSKTISHSPNALHNEEWSEESERQLLMRPGSQRCLNIGLQLQENQIIHSKAALRTMLIS